ncbi:GFA family protein [Microbulbifer sp. VAAC004]
MINGDLAFHEKQADSRNTARRGFCPRCGSHNYAENSGMPWLEFVHAGSLHDLEQFNPTMIVYESSGEPWDYMDPDLQMIEKVPKM